MRSLSARSTRGCPGGGRRRRHAFSLIELVVVVSIIAIISAIAIRRLARHTEQTGASAAAKDVAVLESAIERYRGEHGSYPTSAGIVEQLTKYSDLSGNTSDTRTPPYVYGPYVRKIPSVPIGPARGSATVGPAAGAGVGWVYDQDTGAIRANDGT
jgi:prepilin-type N-terminal cleavage/methylation domain-containing protein